MRNLFLLVLFGVLTACATSKVDSSENITIEECIFGKWEVYQEINLDDKTSTEESKTYEFLEDNMMFITKLENDSTEVYNAKYFISGINIEIFTPYEGDYFKSDECKIVHLDNSNMVLETIYNIQRKVIFLKR